jgi:hypothetical protein
VDSDSRKTADGSIQLRKNSTEQRREGRVSPRRSQRGGAVIKEFGGFTTETQRAQSSEKK